jgi:hypothetical protein
MESYVKLKPVKLEPVKLESVNQEPNLKEKVLMVENHIEMFIKQIEVIENNQVVKAAVPLPVFEQVVEAVVAPVVEPVGIDDTINHIEHETRIDLEPYTKHKEYGDFIEWDKYVKEHLDENTNNKISKRNVIYELLKHTYDENSEKAIFGKICKFIPKVTIKMKDISRGKFAIY